MALTDVRQKRGRDGEEFAVAFLRSRGVRILAQNWRPQKLGLRGEIDIVAQSKSLICFVEVKTRSSIEHGEPQEAVTVAKQRQISRLATAYVMENRLVEATCRFDIVEVHLEAGRKPRATWIENAFEFQG
jgi:putative endonuclease